MSLIDKINHWSPEEARVHLFKCCASTRWLDQMLSHRPFSSLAAALATSEKIWFSLSEKDWLEAFMGHPKIGDLNSLRKKYENTTNWTTQEQSSVNEASENTLVELSKLNNEYEKKNGFIFIVCATGKSALEMLELLRQRMKNNRAYELKNASIEQNKITKLRLEKL